MISIHTLHVWMQSNIWASEKAHMNEMTKCISNKLLIRLIFLSSDVLPHDWYASQTHSEGIRTHTHTHAKRKKGEQKSSHPLHVVWKWIQISRITYVNVIFNQQTVHITLDDIDSFFSLEWIGAFNALHWIPRRISDKRVRLLTQLNFVLPIIQSMRLIETECVCYAYLICSCVISDNIQCCNQGHCLKRFNFGKEREKKKKKNRMNRDTLDVSLIPGEYAFQSVDWESIGITFCLKRFNEKQQPQRASN